ncbi:MAG: CoA-binding protein, partial [Pseudomonas sp.]
MSQHLARIRDNLKRLLAPKHLAFIGGRSMARALKRCAEGGYQGQLWLVNPQHDSLEGVPCVRSVADLPCGPDAVFIATNRELTITCVAALACSGGDAGLIADYAERNGLSLPKLADGQRAELAEVLPS